ncbi:hypothetical protein [Deinococcus sp. Marseille-Q6407]|uniref:hypothetical protein n=1 Tax=Deinococcus sp. Marseille-Q6407 TaxID=2969223 RepID=UPI0021C16C18|nr:hypothetical protein [Deinococcus sp. Marseille-Q6407]
MSRPRTSVFSAFSPAHVSPARFSLAYFFLALLTLSAPAGAVTLSPLPAQTLTFAAGRDVQAVSFSEDGQQLLTLDEAGLTLWQVTPLRPLWRSHVRLDWRPRSARWKAGEIVLLGDEGRRARLAAADGRQLGEDRLPLPAEVRRALGLAAQAPVLHFTAQGIWQPNPQQPGLPFDVGGGQLSGFYAQQGRWLAVKPPGYAPLEVWQSGQAKYRLGSIFPAWGFESGGGISEQLSLSPDGRWLAWSAQRRVTLWDLGSGEKRAVLRPDPYQESSESLQVGWTPSGDTLLLWSDRALWRYQVPAANAGAAADFALLDRTAAPRDALIRTVASNGALVSGAQSLLLSRPGQTPAEGTTAAEVIGPVPQQVFFSDDGTRTLVLSPPALWVFGTGAAGKPLALRLPAFAEGSWLTLDSADRLTIYGRDLSQTPGQEPGLAASVWQADLRGLTLGQLIPLRRLQVDPRLNCPGGAAPAGQWLTPVLRDVRLCQQERQLSGLRGTQAVWTLELPDVAQALVTPDGQWFAPQLTSSRGQLSVYRSDTGQRAGQLALPTLPPDTFWNPELRVDAQGRWAAVHAGRQWYLADLRRGSVQNVPQLEGAVDVAFVGDRLAATLADRVVWLALQ